MNAELEALRFFRAGFDTFDIARLTGATEAEVCERIHAARIAERFVRKTDTENGKSPSLAGRGL
jgi:hypothetical protein